MKDKNVRTALYRLYDAEGRLLYAGIATFPEYRWEQHASQKNWWHLVARKTVEWHVDRVSALVEEARVTAAEKPLYDLSWRHTRDVPRGGYDDTEDRLAVRELLTRNVRQGVYPPGTRITTGMIARECNVSRTTASSVMHELAERGGILLFLIHGRYQVADQADLAES